MRLKRTSAVFLWIVAALGVAVGARGREETNPEVELARTPAFTPAPPPPTVVVVAARLSDNGDGDRWADTYETVSMRIVLYNNMGQDLTNLRIELSTEDPDVACISRDRILVGDLADGERRLTTEAFQFMVAGVERASNQHELTAEFSLRMTANQFMALPAPERLAVDLDLDVTGGDGSTTFFEGFEDGLGAFEPHDIDEGLNPPDNDLGNHEAGS